MKFKLSVITLCLLLITGYAYAHHSFAPFDIRNGSPKMAMGGFEKDGTFHSIHERVGQRSANEAADAIESGESVDSVLERHTEEK